MCLAIIAGYGAAKAEYPSPTKTSLLWAAASTYSPNKDKVSPNLLFLPLGPSQQ